MFCDEESVYFRVNDESCDGEKVLLGKKKDEGYNFQKQMNDMVNIFKKIWDK